MKPVRLSEILSNVPEKVLNVIMQKLGLKNDAALARRLDVRPPVISKVRNRKMRLGSAILLRMLEATGLSLRELYALSMNNVPDIAIDTAPEKATCNTGENRHAQDVSMYGICRRHNKRRDTHSSSWHVSIMRSGVTYSKTFSDSRHGGEHAALIAAREYRDDILRKTQPLPRKEVVQIVKSNCCSSGIPGVWRIDRLHPFKKGGKRGWYRVVMWKAQLQLAPGKVRTRTFSVRKYGEQGAFELAVQARQRFLEEMEGYVLYSPAAQLLQAQNESNAEAGTLVDNKR